jgi:hypothetical protein
MTTHEEDATTTTTMTTATAKSPTPTVASADDVERVDPSPPPETKDFGAESQLQLHADSQPHRQETFACAFVRFDRGWLPDIDLRWAALDLFQVRLGCLPPPRFLFFFFSLSSSPALCCSPVLTALPPSRTAKL